MSLLAFIVTAPAFGLPNPIQVTPGKINSPIENGNTIGGRAGEEFSLLGIRAETIAGRDGERFVISYGDVSGKPFKGEPGFFQVELDRDARRIVIDMAQMSRTAIAPNQLAKVLGTSKYVASTEMTMDPHDGSTNITLALKTPVKMSVNSVKGAQGRIVIEVQPLAVNR